MSNNTGLDISYDKDTNTEVVISGGSYAYVYYGNTSSNLYIVPSDPAATVTVTSSPDITDTGNFGVDGYYTYSINGISAVATPVDINVLAEDGITSQTYTVYFIQYRNDTDISQFKINGQSVSDGETVYLVNGTSNVSLSIIPIDGSASVTNVGSNPIHGIDYINGSNYVIRNVTNGLTTITATVVAQDPNFQYTYTVYIDKGTTDTTLSTFSVNNVVVTNASVVNLANGATSASLSLVPTDPSASIASVFIGTTVYTSLDGQTYDIQGLITGDNIVTIRVASKNPFITQDYTVNMHVYSNDTGLSTFTINGQDVTNLAKIEFLNSTMDASLVVIKAQPGGSINVLVDYDVVQVPYSLINGECNISLNEGDNNLIVTVTAEDTSTTTSYNINLYKYFGNPTVASIKVNSIDLDNNTSYLSSVTTDASLTISLFDQLKSSVKNISGAIFDSSMISTPFKVLNYNIQGLVAGYNPVSFTVAAEDNTITYDYSFNVYVFRNDTSLSSFQVNSVDVLDGSFVYFSYGTLNSTLNVVPSDLSATIVSISGLGLDATLLDANTHTYDISGLVIGNNVVTVKVAAEDPSVTHDYTVNMHVYSNDATLSTFQVNSVNVFDGGVAYLPYGTVDASLSVIPTDAHASIVSVSIGAAVYTSPDGQTYDIQGLVTGNNGVAVRVAAEDPLVTYDNIVNLYVYNNDTYVNQISITAIGTFYGLNNETPSANLPYSAAGQMVSLYIVQRDSNSTISAINGTNMNTDPLMIVYNPSGNFQTYEVSNLVEGDNTIFFSVLAEDGVTLQNYTLPIYINSPSSNTNATFTLDGVPHSSGDSMNLNSGTTSISYAISPGQYVNVAGNLTGTQQLHAGANIFSFTAVAEDGTTQDYYVNIYVIKSTDTSLATFQINGQNVSDGATVYVHNPVTSVTYNIIPNHVNASFTISGYTNLLDTQSNTITVVVTAEETTAQQTYTVTVIRLSSDTSLATFQIAGQSVSNGSTIQVSYPTTSVSYSIQTTNPDASYQVFGNTGLIADQSNQVSVVVRPQDPSAASQTYTVNVYRQNNNTALKTYKVNGQTISDGSNVKLVYGTTSANFAFETYDSGSSIVSVTGSNVLGNPLVFTSSLNNTDVSTNTLSEGRNTINVVVRSEDPLIEETHTFYVTIEYDVRIGPVSLVSQGKTYPVQVGSTTHFRYIRNITVLASPMDASASVLINNLSTTNVPIYFGINTVAITVVAKDGITSQTYYVYVSMDAICFKVGTKIQCLVAGKDTYLPIEKMKKGTLVKTLASGYVPVEMIGRSTILNPGTTDRVKHRLYRCASSCYPELFEPLYITGCHSILVDKLTPDQRAKTVELLGKTYVTEGKGRLMACIDNRAEPYAKSGNFEIWHFALENEDYYANYGVYANGLLVESSSKRMMHEYSGMEIM
jgi:hypothetical protein